MSFFTSDNEEGSSLNYTLIWTWVRNCGTGS